MFKDRFLVDKVSGNLQQGRSLSLDSMTVNAIMFRTALGDASQTSSI